MKTIRRKFTAKFKAQVAIKAIKKRARMTDLAKRFEVHTGQITTWKREFLERAYQAFGGTSDAPKLTALSRKSMTSTAKLARWRCSEIFF